MWSLSSIYYHKLVTCSFYKNIKGKLDILKIIIRRIDILHYWWEEQKISILNQRMFHSCKNIRHTTKKYIVSQRTSCQVCAMKKEEERKLYFNGLLHIHQHTFLKYMMHDTVGYWGKNQKTICLYAIFPY